MRGTFIVFEGGDSVGKTTQMRYLTDWLTSRVVDFVQTRQPGGTPLGSHIRDLVLNPIHGDVSPWAETLLYAADKAQHVYEVVEPELAAGRVVVCDRYVDSTLAYQGAGRRIDVGQVAQVAAWATGGLRPDLTILLDADPATALEKIHDKDRLEGAGMDFHRSVRAHFLDLAAADPGRYLVVTALREREVVVAEIRAGVAPLLGLEP